MKTKKIYTFLCIAIVFVVFVIGIAYSALQSNLAINDISSVVRVIKDIRITGISVSNSSSEVVSLEDYNVSSISSNIILPSSDSYVTYKVNITNIGNTEMGILNITGLPDNLELSPSIDEIKSNKICDSGGTCSLGITEELYLTIRYKNGGYNSGNINYNFALKFDFEEAFDVNIDGLDSSDYKKFVLNNDTYSIDIGNGYALSNITVNMNGISTSNFTYSNGILSIPNVTGDLDIIISSDLPSYSVTINGLDSSVSYSRTVREGNSFSVNIGSDYTTSDVFVRMGGNTYTGFTLQNGLLTIPNVTGDLNIGVVKVAEIEFMLDDSNTSGTTTVNAPTLNDFITQSFDGYNTSDKNITSVTVEVVYSFNSGNTSQSVNLVLSYEKDGQVITLPGPNEAAKTIPFNQKGNNIHKSVQFTGLSVPTNTLFSVKIESNNISNAKPKVTQMILTAQFE